MAVFAHEIGFHVLAVAPANSNADHFARLLGDFAEKLGIRLYPSSRDLDLRDMNPQQASSRQVGHTDGAAADVYDLINVLSELGKERTRLANAREYDVQHAVIRAADAGQEHLMRRLRNSRTGAIGNTVDIWEVFRECLEKVRSSEDVLKEEDMDLLSSNYAACKGHIIGKSRFLITTTGNAACSELLEYWAKGDHGVPCRGVMVFIDEAAKDVELNLWIPMVCNGWDHKVVGVVMFGDDKQLKPTNTSSKGKVVMNPFSGRLDIPLPCRLVNEGFPCVRLIEQRRMHHCISSFPSRHCYDGKLKNGPGTTVALDTVSPGLKGTLVRILGQSFSDPEKRKEYENRVSDEDARLHYIEVTGARIIKDNSAAVVEHIDVFFDKMFKDLHLHFGNTMAANVMVICFYRHAIGLWDKAICARQRRDSLTKEDMPRILTVDASQGQESLMVIFDGSFQHRDRIGFMEDPGRCNVAVTRAQAVFWIIGGDMEAVEDDEANPVLYQYKQELKAGGRCHRLK